MKNAVKNKGWLLLICVLLASNFPVAYSGYAQEVPISIIETKQKLDKNIIRISVPPMLLDNALGIGISYERIFGQDQRLGAVLPFSWLRPLYDNPDNMGTTPIDVNPFDLDRVDGLFNFFYLSPGFKYYPSGQAKWTYSVGMNLVLGYGLEKGSRYSHNPASYGDPVYGDIKRSVYKMGIVVNNYLTVHFSRVFCMGISLGLGIRYLDLVKETNVNIVAPAIKSSYPMEKLAQASLDLDFRF